MEGSAVEVRVGPKEVKWNGDGLGTAVQGGVGTCRGVEWEEAGVDTLRC